MKTEEAVGTILAFISVFCGQITGWIELINWAGIMNAGLTSVTAAALGFFTTRILTNKFKSKDKLKSKL